ncbi:uncharacterized protein LOC128983299 [Macrosteles quadrilineatus]|uniref:uncharacterized protein LOC128983299 n=1 Tax=Macrosteles quadrilineatus TaxID=74068 RepID=UPI0023E262E4|nr:uncharacterized protein LOC128983299 [Macrosteles quadrilineatus]
MFAVLSCVVSVLFLASNSVAKLPPIKCDYNAEFDNCFIKYLRRNIPHLAKQGIPEAKIPPLDPFEAPSMRLKFNSAMAKGKIDVKHVVLKGLANTKISKFQTNVGKESQDKKQIVLAVHTFHPSLTLEGNFEKSSLKAMGYTLADAGSYKVTLRNVKVKLFARGKLVKKGATYQPVLDILTVEQPEVGHFQLEASDVIKNDPKLSKSVITMVNSFWEIFYNEVFPAFKSTIEKLGKKFISSYLKQEVLVPIGYVEGK